jgi:large subunit ribosomal protein L21
VTDFPDVPNYSYYTMASASKLSVLTRLVPRIAAPRLLVKHFSTSMPKLIKPIRETPAEIHTMDQLQFLERKLKYTYAKDVTPLREAHALYATIHIHNRKFLVTEGDQISLPVRFKDVEVGNVLNFDQVSNIGSRDYTLTGKSRIDPHLFSVKGVVVEKSRVKRKILEKTRRRRRHTRHFVIKNPLTVIRISELKVIDPAGSGSATGTEPLAPELSN